MAEHAIHPPIHLVIHPDEPVRSLEAAAKVVRRHAASHPDRKAEDLLHRIETALTTAQAEAAGKAFRDWAEAEGLLLVPPEDHQRHGLRRSPQPALLALEDGRNRLDFTASIDR